MTSFSPYQSVPEAEWLEKTKELVAAHPLEADEIVEVVLQCWDAIFKSSIGPRRFRIGKHLLPKPQIMGFFLHELIPLEFERRYPGLWRGDETAEEKDLVYVPDSQFSAEIKTSSHPSRIFGNRSYAQETQASKKSKSGYCLAVNFEKFSPKVITPRVIRVRFGWLDAADWLGQKAATGQQARLDPIVEQAKLLTVHSLE